MEQILTIEEEKKYIAKYFIDEFHPSYMMDEFTGEKSAEVCIYNFVRTPYKETADGKITADGKSFSESDFYDYVCEHPKFDLELLTTFSDKKTKPEYKLNLLYSLDRLFPCDYDIRIIKVSVQCVSVQCLSADGARYEIPMGSLKTGHINTDSGDYYGKRSFSATITEETARILMQNDTKIRVSFDDLKYNRVVDSFFHKMVYKGMHNSFLPRYLSHQDKIMWARKLSRDKYIELANYYHQTIILEGHDTIYTDEQIEDLFEYCQQAKSSKEDFKEILEKIYEKDLEIRYRNNKKESLEKDIRNNVNPYAFDTLELLFTNPMKIKEVKALKDFCKKNDVETSASEWLFSIRKKYDKDAILEDVKRCRKKYKTARCINIIMRFVFLAVACALFCTCVRGCANVLDYDGDKLTCFGITFPTTVWVLIWLFGPIVCGYMGVRGFNNPNIQYNEITSKFIEDFEIHFGKKK